MKYRFIAVSILTLFMSILTIQPHAMAALSTFDTDNEGWSVIGDAPANAVYHSTGGNPGGYISSKDYVTGGVWYWEAPSAFLGNMSGAYGQSLSYDLRQSYLTSQFERDDIFLIGNSTTLAFDTSYNPGTTWTSYSVVIDENSGWRIGNLSGVLATQADIQSVLSSLDTLRIRGEFRTGTDTGSLDNVNLTVVPEPISSVLFLVGGAVLGIRRFRR